MFFLYFLMYLFYSIEPNTKTSCTLYFQSFYNKYSNEYLLPLIEHYFLPVNYSIATR